MIEIICKETGKDLNEKFECSPKYLRRKLRTSQTKLREVFEYCQRDGRLLVTFSDKKWEFQIPKIAEIKDNYTKDLQATSKKPSKHKEKEKEKEKDVSVFEQKGIVKEVLAYLKEVTGKNYKPTTLVHAKWINARVEEGHGLVDFKHVIDVKSSQWLGDANNDKYLRPETLFGNRFEGYRNEDNESYWGDIVLGGVTHRCKSKEEADDLKKAYAEGGIE